MVSAVRVISGHAVDAEALLVLVVGGREERCVGAVRMEFGHGGQFGGMVDDAAGGSFLFGVAELVAVVVPDDCEVPLGAGFLLGPFEALLKEFPWYEPVHQVDFLLGWEESLGGLVVQLYTGDDEVALGLYEQAVGGPDVVVTGALGAGEAVGPVDQEADGCLGRASAY